MLRSYISTRSSAYWFGNADVSASTSWRKRLPSSSMVAVAQTLLHQHAELPDQPPRVGGHDRAAVALDVLRRVERSAEALEHVGGSPRWRVGHGRAAGRADRRLT